MKFFRPRSFALWAAGVASLGALLIQLGCQQTAELPVAAAATSPENSITKLTFNEHIQPILAENCYACHGPDPGGRKASLRLDRAVSALAPHEKMGPAIIPGKPDESPLIQRIESTKEKEIMPPPESHKTLKPAEIALLRRWVSEGAAYQEHWAFITPQRPTVPALAKNPIDAFVQARLSREHLTATPEADRSTLIRRVSLDLTGLPPSPAEIEAYLADRSPDAYERVVDRLLASPRYGEHRTRYWLDYARYADTHGIHFDNYRAIWPYRDYVIRAFNGNKPFDRFVREQLAGDLLPARTLDELAATGFVRGNLTTNEGGTIPEEIFINQTRDRVEAFGATFLGLTTGCAACHDHKFDPFTQRDFYGLAAYLSNTAEKPWDFNKAAPAPVLGLPKKENRASAEFILSARADLQVKLAARQAEAPALITTWLASGQRPQPVSSQALELRLRLDEGHGDIVKNSAPGTLVPEFKATINPLVWGEKSWLWSSMRMDIATRLALGNLADVEASEKFSAGGWVMLRTKAGDSNTGNGALLARRGDEQQHGGAGWEIYQEGGRFVVNLVPDPSTTKAKIGPDGKAEDHPKPGISVATKDAFARDEWVHVFFTYNGSRRAVGLKIYINGQIVDVENKVNYFTPAFSIRTNATLQLGRRDDYEPMRETRFQDIRFYRRELTKKEVAQLPFADVAAEIIAREPDPKKWTPDEMFVATNRYFLGEVDPIAIDLAASVASHDIAFAALTKSGEPTLIASEKSTPAYADVLIRGDYYARGDRVGPLTPHFLPPLPPGATANRRGLAEWLLAPEQPLFARVTVNRMWQEIFGRGLVATVSDFGVMGEKPSHPELLDWLAVEFRESGWDTKRFYRQLVTSAAYRRSAQSTAAQHEADPANRLLARGPRFRMDAEMLRDSALASSGLLVEKLGGPSVKPYQPKGLWEEVAMPESDTGVYVPDKGEGLYRRSVYTFWKRASMDPSMETFDATSREVVCTRRARTNTPLQAFVTMNDPQWFEAARKLAERTLHAAPTAADRLNFMARTTLSRPLMDKEQVALLKTLEKFHTRFSSDQAAAQAVLTVGDSPADPALNPVELAEWTMVASQFLNLDEFLTK